MVIAKSRLYYIKGIDVLFLQSLVTRQLDVDFAAYYGTLTLSERKNWHCTVVHDEQ